MTERDWLRRLDKNHTYNTAPCDSRYLIYCDDPRQCGVDIQLYNTRHSSKCIIARVVGVKGAMQRESGG